MGIYTPHVNPEVDRTIGLHMGTLASVCASKLGTNLDSLVLAGSFGRGEGSVLLGADGSVQPLRDYDVRAIVRRPVPTEIVEDIRREFMAASDLGRADEHFSGEAGFSITLEPLTHEQLAGPFVRDHDLRAYDHLTASRVIWGHDCSPALRFPASAIPKVNGLRFLYQKMVGLVGHYPGREADRMAVEEARRTLLYECDKTFIEICTALCLLAGNYVPSYRERADIFAREWEAWFPVLAKELPSLAADVVRATEEKLRPGSTKAPTPGFAFYRARKALLVVHRHYVRRLYGVEIKCTKASWRLLSVLKARYYRGVVSTRLEDKGLNNPLSCFVLNEAYGRALRLRYARGEGAAALLKAVAHGEAPIIDIFVASWCALASLPDDESTGSEPEGDLLAQAHQVLGRLPSVDSHTVAQHRGGWDSYRSVRAALADAYMRWEKS